MDKQFKLIWFKHNFFREQEELIGFIRSKDWILLKSKAAKYFEKYCGGQYVNIAYSNIDANLKIVEKGIYFDKQWSSIEKRNQIIEVMASVFKDISHQKTALLLDERVHYRSTECEQAQINKIKQKGSNLFADIDEYYNCLAGENSKITDNFYEILKTGNEVLMRYDAEYA